MKLGFIGCGNMASAIIGGVEKSGLVKAEDLMGSARTEATLTRVRGEFGIAATRNNRKVALFADVLVLAVKPAVMEDVVAEIRDAVDDRTVVVSLAAGRTLSWFADRFGKTVKIVRTMPNTPALVGEGMTTLCRNDAVTDEDLAAVRKIFESCGRTEILPEPLIDAATSLGGSSPAYVFMFMEALADAAVLQGMPRASAYRMAAQTVLGSAKLMLETGKHPGELKDMVCSPGGTTIEGVRVLEERGMRSAVIEALTACGEKAKKL